MANFLDLPAELRVQTHHYATVANTPCVITQSHPYAALGSEIHRPPAQPPITRTSRLLRHESLSVFYTDSTFTMQSFWTVNVENVAGWLSAMGPMDRGLLTRLLACRLVHDKWQTGDVELALTAILAGIPGVEVVKVPAVPREGLFWELDEVWHVQFGEKVGGMETEGKGD